MRMTLATRSSCGSSSLPIWSLLRRALTQVTSLLAPAEGYAEAPLPPPGHTVLLHCLAGAHRAGTAAVLAVMFLSGLESSLALTAVQRARPVVQPIGSLSELLVLADSIITSKR